MASVINTNIAATRTHNVYNRNNEFMNAAMTRVATGMKINSAKDGASTWAISEKMRERIRANDQANQNIQNDTALLKVAQGGVGNTIDILKTLKERAINAMNDSNMDADRDRIAVEVEELLKQIDKNATTVKFNGRTLLDGTGATDSTGGNFKPSGDTDATAGVNAPDKVNPPTADNTKGSNAVFTLATDSTKNLVTDLGFKAGDKITFSWKEDGTEKTADAITVEATDTLAGLVSKFGTSGTFSKLTLMDVAAGDDVGSVTKPDGTTPLSNAGTDAALYAVGTGETQITDFAVAVVGADDKTNTTAQAAIKFSGVQQAKQTPTADHSVASITGLQKATAAGGGTADTSTTLVALEPAGGTAIAANDVITVKIGSETGTYTVSAATATVQDLVTNLSGLTNTKFGWFADQAELTDAAGNKVKDSDGNVVKANGAGLYAIGKSGEAATVSIEVTASGTAKTTALSSPSVVYNYAAADSGNGNGKGGSGSTTDLTFYIGGDKNMGITASIGSMTVSNLFDGSDSGTFAGLFTKQSTASNALDAIDKALDTALNEQTKLGAMESRLGYASDNITTMNENLEAADSVMRDSDIAKEMTSYMKYAVLSQASQYMLAQAGQNAFQVLNLLQQ